MRDFAALSVTAALHRFGPGCTVLPQSGWNACSTLDQMVKMQMQIFHKPLISNDLSTWHGACKELRDLATGALP
ncbi:hypothetical protein [Variovorax sp. YR752]|uniref:hypothetical protein n=1 Tax=Variovorax sp. YR752 TaxID=1884383 RepID=UPI00117D4592|nr:hypothetical protein [Variovorax sp. YR752]